MSNQLKKNIFSKRNIAVGTVFFLLGLSFATWTSRIADIQEKLKLSDGELGGILISVPIGLWISLLLSGWLIKKYSSRKIAFLGLIFFNVVLIIIGLSNNILQFTVCLFLSGLFYSAVNVAMNTQGTIAEQNTQKNLLPFFHGIWSIAGFVGAFAGTLLMKSNTAIIMHFSGIAFFGILTLFLLKKYLYDNPELEKEGKTFAIPEKSLIVLGVIAFFAMICEGVMYDWSVIYFKKEVYNAGDNIGIGYSVFMAMMAVGRFGNNFLLSKTGIRNLILINALLIFSGILLAILYPSLIGGAIGFGLSGLGISSMIPLVVGVASKTKKMAPASGIASVLTIGFIGSLVGPPLIGFLSDHFSLKIAFLLLVVSSIFMGGLSRYIKG